MLKKIATAFEQNGFDFIGSDIFASSRNRQWYLSANNIIVFAWLLIFSNSFVYLYTFFVYRRPLRRIFLEYKFY